MNASLKSSSPAREDLDRLREEYQRRRQDASLRQTNSPFNPGYWFTIQNRQRDLLAMLRRHGLDDLRGRRVLEVGCGSGGVLTEFLCFGAPAPNLYGVDLLPWRLEEAHVIAPHLPLAQADGRALPFADGVFDLVMQFTAFSSMLDEELKRAVAAEMRRVLRPDGLILWYDFWINPRNRQTAGLRPGEIRTLFPACRYDFRRITLAPPIARRLAPHLWLTAQAIERLKLFNTHYLAAIRPLIP